MTDKRLTIVPKLPENYEIEEVSDKEINLVVSPFEKGYAVSIAHPLKRFLLSSSVGYSPIAIWVDGAAHEYDNISGMREDITDFILNLRSIRFKIKDPNETRVDVSYSFDGPKEVEGRDLENDLVEVVTPDNFLASLNEDAKLRFKLIIAKSFGYIPSEDIRKDVPEGYIAIDAYFTPVRRVDYKITNILVGDNPNYEKVTMNIVTDGQITPQEAFEHSLNLMYSHLKIFDFSRNGENGFGSLQPVIPDPIIQSYPISSLSEEEEEALDRLKTKIEDLDMPKRPSRAVLNAGYRYAGELAIATKKELSEIKNLGSKSIDDIYTVLKKHNLSQDDIKNMSNEVISSFKKEYVNK
jgi:DNA-directed RNA polymerase subunit alpha